MSAFDRVIGYDSIKKELMQISTRFAIEETMKPRVLSSQATHPIMLKA